MKKLAIAAAVALMAGGCAHQPQQMAQPHVNRAVKADKYAAPKKSVPVEVTTPNGTVKKRWQWPHPKWLH